jgi:predicted transcriptional regulator of viral defense system
VGFRGLPGLAKPGKLRHDVAMSNNGKVSLHEAKVFLALRGKPDQWLTNDEIAKDSEVSTRTARQYTARFVKHGLLERAETFPAYKFRWATEGTEPNPYRQRIEVAIEVFGLG